MDLQEKARLEKLLGMLGSSFDGERANAARMIAQMAERKRLTITELIYGSQRQQTPRSPWEEKPQPRPKPQAKPKPKPFGFGTTMIAKLADIAANSDSFEFVLTAWECQFAADVSNRYAYDYELSEKQFVIVEKILRKVEVAQGAG